MNRPPLMTMRKQVDGLRLASLFVPELRQLLDLRVKKLHEHFDIFRNYSCAANHFTYICEIIEVLNALQNAGEVHRDGEIRWRHEPTYYFPPFYTDYQEEAFRDGEGI